VGNLIKLLTIIQSSMKAKIIASVVGVTVLAGGSVGGYTLYKNNADKSHVTVASALYSEQNDDGSDVNGVVVAAIAPTGSIPKTVNSGTPLDTTAPAVTSAPTTVTSTPKPVSAPVATPKSAQAPVHIVAAPAPEPKGFKNPAFANSSQVFLVTASSTSTSYATGSTYEKVGGVWQKLSTFPIRLGSNGMSYTRVQDSGKTPAGILNILSAFGVANNPGSNYSYHKVTTADYWDLRDGSPTYNRMVSGNPGGDAEHLADYPVQYKYALVTDFNYSQAAGRGGAIFIHVNGSGATGSCISMSEGNIIGFIRWVNPAKNPKVLVVPNSDLSNYFY